MWKWIAKKVLPLLLPLIIEEVKKWLEDLISDSESLSDFSRKLRG